jgi:hypothetical protein
MAAFEQHYFECADCAADVESAATLVAHARTVLRGNPEQVRATSAAHARNWRSAGNGLLALFRARPAFAAISFAGVALICLCAYQTFVTIPRLREAAVAADSAFVLPAFALAGASRGEEPTISIRPGARSFAIYFDIDPQAAYPEYRCLLKDSAGSVRFALRFAAPPAGQPMTVSFPAHKLQPGRYDLAVNGLREGRETPAIASYPFTLQIK